MQVRLIIIGAGIAGLGCAIALARNGWPVTVYEQRQSLSEIGAGIQLGPNALQVLRHWGVEEALKQSAVAVSTTRVGNLESGQQLCAIKFGRQGNKVEYLTVHRADLQRALFKTVSAFPQVELHFGTSFDALTETTHNLNNGTALIGADGLWSKVRASLFANRTPAIEYSGKIAFRWLAPSPLSEDPQAVGLWLGQRRHLVHYPVSGGSVTNIVAMCQVHKVDLEDLPQRWDTRGSKAKLAQYFAGCSSHIQKLIDTADATDLGCWPLYALKPFDRFDGAISTQSGPVPTLLVGDAAHAMQPHLAQGAALALEDAAVIAHCLGPAKSKPDFPAAFAQFSTLRRARVHRAQTTAARYGQIYQATGPVAWARNIALKYNWVNTNRLAWLYHGFPASYT